MLLKFFSLLNIIYSGNSHENILLGGEHDENGCLTSAGFSWCSHSNNCVRHWETPCSDYFTSCNDCLSKQNNGMMDILHINYLLLLNIIMLKIFMLFMVMMYMVVI